MDSYIINFAITSFEPNLIALTEKNNTTITKDVKQASVINLSTEETVVESVEHTLPNLPNENELLRNDTKATGETHESARNPTSGFNRFFQRWSPDYSLTRNQNQKATWDDQNARKKFIFRVLGITAIGIGITFCLTVFMLLSKDFRRLLYTEPLHTILLVLAGCFWVISLGIICCCPRFIFRGPYAIFHYFVWVFNLTVLVLYAVSISRLENVIIAVCCTVCMVMLATLIVRFVNVDFTKYIGIVCVITIALIVTSLIATLMGLFLKVKWFTVVLDFAFAALLFIILIIDIQSIVGGRRLELQPDMYWYGALSLYVDIVELFLKLLEVINCISGDR